MCNLIVEPPLDRGEETRRDDDEGDRQESARRDERGKQREAGDEASVEFQSWKLVCDCAGVDEFVRT